MFGSILSARTPTIPSEVVLGIPQSLQANIGVVPLLQH
jgi:hypothetical protein